MEQAHDAHMHTMHAHIGSSSSPLAHAQTGDCVTNTYCTHSEATDPIVNMPAESWGNVIALVTDVFWQVEKHKESMKEKGEL